MKERQFDIVLFCHGDQFFYQGFLGGPLTLETFNQRTYFRDERDFIAGSLVHYGHVPTDAGTGVYALEYWPSDPVPGAKSTGSASSG